MFATNKSYLSGICFRKSRRAERLGLMASTEELKPGCEENMKENKCPNVVLCPGDTSSRESRTINRLKLALEFVSLGLLAMTVLFIWQITKQNNASAKVC